MVKEKRRYIATVYLMLYIFPKLKLDLLVYFYIYYTLCEYLYSKSNTFLWRRHL